MTQNELRERYFEWMYQLVCGDIKLSYRRLLTRLNEIEFTYLIGLDGNRAEDGIELRYRFGYETDIDCSVISAYLDDHPCSVLEMMLALSIRCEEHIMANPDIGDRTSQWFWAMVRNLGLGSMSGSRYDQKTVDSIVYRMLDRKYQRDGTGGLFAIPNCTRDLRTTDIWYQMCWYLNSILQL